MFKTFNKTILLMLLGTLSVLNASAPNPVGDYIGATDINTTAVRINFEDNSTNENGFHISGDGIDLDLPANDKTVNKYVYANLENLDCTKTYIIKIWSYNDDGNSSKKSRAFNIHSTFGVDCNDTSIPDAPGPYIGVTDINDTAVRINFLDNSDNETGFRIFGSDDINVTLPPNDETVDQNVYANLTGLICNHTYTIQALAFNGSGDSLPTDVRAFNIHTTFGVPCDGNHIPVANAGADQTVADSTQVQLDGSASSDADGDPLTYQWTMISKPNDSNATLSDATLEKPTFVADVNGTYDIQLIVNDGHVDSVADTVVITVTDGDNNSPVPPAIDPTGFIPEFD